MKSQNDRVLTWLRAKRSITQLQALKMFGCMRLGAIIYRLRKKYGKDYIVTEMMPFRNRYDRTVYVARYLL